MKQRRDLYLVAASLLTWGIGEGMFYIFQPLYIQELGADPILIGTILGINGLGMTLAQIPAGYLADRFGRRPIMWFIWVMGLISTIIMASATSLKAFVVGLLLYGLTSAVVSPMNSYVSAARGDWSVGRSISFISAMYNTGAILGPLVGGLIAQRLGLRSVYMLAAAIFFISTIIILFVRKQPVEKFSPQEKGLGLLRNTRFMLSIGILVLIMFAIYLPTPLASNFLQNERGLSLAAIGQLGTIGNAGNVVIMLALGHLPAFTALLFGQASMLVFAFLLWRGNVFPWYGLAYFMFGGYRLCRAMSNAFVRPLVHDAQVGLAFGITEAVNNMSFVVAPLLAGFLYTQNPYSIFPVSMAAISLTMGISLVAMRYRSAIKQRILKTRFIK